MRPLVVVGPERAPRQEVEALRGFSAATVHEALGRQGSLGRRLRPLQPGARLTGTALTVLCPPGDNLTVHVAVEQIREGDVLVVTTTSPCRDGYVGELLATSMRARGALGLVTTTGIRDTAAIRALRFPVWCRAVSITGTVKETAGAVNLPVSIGGTVISPGDVIIADDDGVVCVPRARAAEVAEASRQRDERETGTRRALAEGGLGLDVYGMRPLLERLGVTYRGASPGEGPGGGGG